MTTPALRVEQALYSPAHDGPRRWLRSPEFLEEWLPAGEALAGRFGTPPPEAPPCPEALFAQPFGRGRVAVVRASDGSGEGLAPGPLRFHFLVLSAELYRHLGDPFEIADRFPAPWQANRDLSELEWPPEPLPPRTVEELRAVLKEGNGPFLLGATQLLVDGGRVLLRRAAPDELTLRRVWALLPSSTRAEVWPATFAFSRDLGAQALVIPHMPAEGIEGYSTEEQVLDYPDSRYERNLQIAVESGDQQALDRLLARRSSSETMWLAVYILAGAVGLALLSKIVAW